MDPYLELSGNLTEFLRCNLRPGQEAEVLIHNEREEVIVLIDGKPILSCTFDDLIAGPGGSVN